MADSESTGKSIITFKALQLVNEQRNAYGLRYSDFARYRKHCTNRTHRLRSTLKMTHGKGREFKPTHPVSSEHLKDGHLQLLLFEAERAWAYSQELISSSLLPRNEGQAGTLRHRATGRFRRAVNWSTQLLSHCQTLFASSRLSAENMFQVTVYTLILNGRFLRYRTDFEDALIQLSVARGLLDQLAARVHTSREQALAILFSDEIGPEIRHCAHELGRSQAYDVDGIVAELATKHNNEIIEGYDLVLKKLVQECDIAGMGGARKKLAELLWEDQAVPVRNPELVMVLLRVQDAEGKLSAANCQDDNVSGQSSTQVRTKRANKTAGTRSKKGVAAYDAILLALSDAEDLARKLAEAQRMSGKNAGSSSAGTRDIHFLHAYIVYQLLARRIQRDLLLVSVLLSSHRSQATRPGTLPKPQTETVDGRLYPAVVKLLDTVLQSLNQMRTLSIVDESPDLASSVEGRVSFTKAQRCFYLARCYATANRYAESLALIQHAIIHLRETRSLLSLSDLDPITSSNPLYYPLSSSDFDHLENDLATDGLHFKKAWFAYNGGSIDTDNKSHKKPLFFNIALNYVQLDMDRLQERAGKKPVPISGRAATVKAEPEKKPTVRAKVEEVEAAIHEPQAPIRGGLSSLLGGWWGKN